MNRNKFLIILGTAHLSTTPGKAAPDSSTQEWEYSRQVCLQVQKELIEAGYNVAIDFLPGNMANAYNDHCANQLYELQRRVAIVNAFCDIYGKKNVIYIPIHLNAAGMGDRWMNARGWCAYTTRGETESDKLATCLYQAAADFLLTNYAKTFTVEDVEKGQVIVRKDMSDGDPDYESSLYVLRKTDCPAVLTENLFMDNIHDLDFLQSEEGFHTIVNIHVRGIRLYLANKIIS